MKRSCFGSIQWDFQFTSISNLKILSIQRINYKRPEFKLKYKCNRDYCYGLILVTHFTAETNLLNVAGRYTESTPSLFIVLSACVCNSALSVSLGLCPASSQKSNIATKIPKAASLNNCSIKKGRTTLQIDFQAQHKTVTAQWIAN